MNMRVIFQPENIRYADITFPKAVKIRWMELNADTQDLRLRDCLACDPVTPDSVLFVVAKYNPWSWVVRKVIVHRNVSLETLYYIRSTYSEHLPFSYGEDLKSRIRELEAINGISA